MYQCSGCDKCFASKGPFFKHRVGDHEVKEGPNRRRCMTTEETEASGKFQHAVVPTGKNAGKDLWRLAAPDHGRPENWTEDDEEEGDD